MFLWLYSILIIIWGAWVRISKSGDGCGTSWPLCNDTIIPDTGNIHTLIELTHRLSTGVYGVLVILLVIWTFKLFPITHAVRKIALFVLSLTILEALIGAKLVLFGLVGENTGIYRIIVMSLHQVTSVLLTGSIAKAYYVTTLAPENKINSPYLISILKIMFLLIIATGGVAALSNTVFPSSSILEGLMTDLNPTSHILLKLRIIHPVLALLLTFTMIFILLRLYKDDPKYVVRLSTCIIVGVTIGIITLVTLSPVYMKLIHLTVAHIIWSVMVKV